MDVFWRCYFGGQFSVWRKSIYHSTYAEISCQWNFDFHSKKAWFCGLKIYPLDKLILSRGAFCQICPLDKSGSITRFQPQAIACGRLALVFIDHHLNDGFCPFGIDAKFEEQVVNECFFFRVDDSIGQDNITRISKHGLMEFSRNGWHS